MQNCTSVIRNPVESEISRGTSGIWLAKHINGVVMLKRIILVVASSGGLSMYEVNDGNEYNSIFRVISSRGLLCRSSMGLYYRTCKKKQMYSPYLSMVE
jgi:hypothetical protein